MKTVINGSKTISLALFPTTIFQFQPHFFAFILSLFVIFSQIHHISFILEVQIISALPNLRRLVSSPGFQASPLIGLRFSHAQVIISVQPSTFLFYYLTSAECVISVSLIATEEGRMFTLTESDINWLTDSAQRLSMRAPGLFPVFYSYWYHAEAVCCCFITIAAYIASFLLISFFFLFFFIQARHMCSVHVRHQPLCLSKPGNTIS